MVLEVDNLWKKWHVTTLRGLSEQRVFQICIYSNRITASLDSSFNISRYN